MEVEIELKEIELEMIKPSQFNMRKTFDSESIIELSENIKKQGLIQPITVRPKNPYYEVVCGERRYRAFNLLSAQDKEKFGKINCIIKQMTDDEAFDAMITENLQRKDVDPIEEAFAFSQLVEKGQSCEEIAARFGKSFRYVFDRIKLNALIPGLKKLVREGQIPLTGAIMLSKLDIENQEQFNKEYSHRTSSVNDIKRFIDDLFMSLERTVWSDCDEWENGEFKSCSDCSMNTSNHGCLFYEMKDTRAKCTNRQCYNDKTVATIIRKVEQMGNNLVKKGKSLDFGKAVIVADSEYSYWSEEKKMIFRKIFESIDKLGYMVVKPDVFNGRSYYDNDDERVALMVENKTLYKCISLFDYNSPRFNVVYYYVRKDCSTSEKAAANLVEVENDRILAKIEGAEKKCKEHTYNALSEMLKKSGYEKNGDELTETEQLAIDIFVFTSLSYKYKSELTEETYCHDYVKYVKENRQDRIKWYREYILEKITQSFYCIDKDVADMQKSIAEEHYPEDAENAVSPITDKYSMKINRLKEQLKGHEEV